MGVQLGLRKGFSRKLAPFNWDLQSSERIRNDYFLILGSQVAVSFDAQLRDQLQALRERIWIAPEANYAERLSDFERWYDQLGQPLDLVSPDIPEDERERDETMEIARSILALIYHGPIGPLPPLPPRPAYVYGHMHFYGDTEPDDVFYRYEYFPTSVRIKQDKELIVKGTYASPSSEVQFVPTGFGAVASFALPTLMPAR